MAGYERPDRMAGRDSAAEHRGDKRAVSYLSKRLAAAHRYAIDQDLISWQNEGWHG